MKTLLAKRLNEAIQRSHLQMKHVLHYTQNVCNIV